ncbi:right-handed parallel beta-helix repeat-containing protein [Candidatus Marinimicrobia bacterium]|nr:right-handed parallel beta-helix repeat-containing protein [Candidatus Neomarinimicrobiota bacterium]
MRLNQYSYPIINYFLTFIIGLVVGVNFFYGNQTIQFKHFIEEVFRNPKEIINNLSDTKPPGDTLSLYISKKNFSILSEKRKYNLLNSYIYKLNNYKDKFDHKKNIVEVKAKFTFENIVSDSKIKLLGSNFDHWGNPNKWSLRIKLKDFGFYRQTKQFNLLIPHTRGFLFDYLLNKISSDYDFISLEYVPVQLFINGKNNGIYLFEDFHNKYLIEKNQKKDSMIFKFKSNNKIKLKHPNEKKISKNQTDLKLFLEENPSHFFSMIDEEKMIVFLAINYLFEIDHTMIDDNLNYYYNPHSNMIEPTLREGWPQKVENSIKNKCNINSIKYFFESSRRVKENIWLSEYIKSIVSQNNNFEEEFLFLVNQIALKYKKYLNSLEYKVYHSILNNETVINNWVVSQGVFLANQFLVQYENYSESLQFSNLEKRTPSSIIFRDTVSINKTIHFKKNQNLLIEKGTVIEFSKNSNLILEGSLNIAGTKSKPVYISNIDSTFSSILINNSPDTSTISNCTFEYLSSLRYGFWNNTGALTFYKSNVKIDNSEFLNNNDGDDFLNITDTDYFSIKSCFFENIKYDALDVDFSNGKIINSSFNKIGNVAIDFSGSNSTISKCIIFSIGDKAISAGEKSNIEIDNSIIKECSYGLVSKDLSFIESYKNSFENNVYDFAVYNKKIEYGSGSLNDLGSYGAKKSLVKDGSFFSTDNDTIIIDQNNLLLNK